MNYELRDGINPDIIKRYTTLFRGRPDAVGDWEGGRKGWKNDNGEFVGEKLHRSHFEKHYTSHDPDNWIGVYPCADTRCTWGCIDIDGKDFDHDWDRMFSLAKDLRDMLHVMAVYAHIERTRNGYHLWVFPEATMEAKAMRRCLMAACKAIDYNPKEVNPKAEELAPGKLGNYVRLPYHGAFNNRWTAGWKRHFVDESGKAILPEDWIDQVQITRIADIEKVASYWTPPPTVHVNIDALPDNIADITTKMSGYTWTIFANGPLEGGDRSGTLVRLGHYMREDEFTQAETLAVLVEADKRWGKFYGRDDCMEQLTKIVEKVYE